MAQYKVVFIEGLFPDMNIEKEILKKVDAEIVVGNCRTEDEVIELAHDADALVAYSFKPISDYLMSNIKKCKIIVRGGIGVDTVDIPAATKNGIIIANLPGYCINEVSDLTMAMMLSLLYKLPVAMSSTGGGEWNRDLVKPLRSLRKLTVGIIGFGNIGRTSARKATAFGMKILFYDPFVETDIKIRDSEAKKVELDELLAKSDVILLHAPLNDKTYHIINKETLRKMKKGTILINTARGGLIETEALVAALKSGRIAGAGLDLIENVPPFGKNHPLLRFDNIIITPYYAWYTEDSAVLARESIAREIARVLGGYYPRAMVNPEVKPVARAGKLKEEEK